MQLILRVCDGQPHAIVCRYVGFDLVPGKVYMVQVSTVAYLTGTLRVSPTNPGYDQDTKQYPPVTDIWGIILHPEGENACNCDEETSYWQNSSAQLSN
jgi:hypothetical protein